MKTEIPQKLDFDTEILEKLHFDTQIPQQFEFDTLAGILITTKEFENGLFKTLFLISKQLYLKIKTKAIQILMLLYV